MRTSGKHEIKKCMALFYRCSKLLLMDLRDSKVKSKEERIQWGRWAVPKAFHTQLSHALSGHW